MEKPSKDPLVGTHIAGRYRIEQRLAAGGMGVVYKAVQEPLERTVALKVLEVRKVSDSAEDFKQRFFLEASLASKLSHPNTIIVHDYGSTEDDLYYIAIEYLSGGTLHTYIRKKGPLRPAQAIHIGAQVCSSLADAHAHGLVHRDLKPGNIMFAPRRRDPYFVKVLDFGLVKVVSGEAKDEVGLTQSGVMMGSPRYMAPEQVRGNEVDHRADIYSFGATFYHAIVGRPPFWQGKAFDAMQAHVLTPAPAFRETWPQCDAPASLEAVILRCLAKDPDDRFQSMDDVLAALQACAAEVSEGFAAGSFNSYTSLPALIEDSHPPQSLMTPSHPGGAGLTSGVVTVDGLPRPDSSEGEEDDGVAAAPKKAGRRGLIAASIAAVAVVGGALAAAMPGAERPTPAPAPGPDEAPVAAAASEEDVELEAAETEDDPPELVPVQLVSEPTGANVRYGEDDLGNTPLPLPIPLGERWHVTLTLDGHEPREVTVIGGQPELTVRLEERPRPTVGRATGARAPSVDPAPTPTKRPRVVTPDLPDPWDE